MKDASQKNIVCLGGGVGTSNLIRGLKHYPGNFTIITSMADDGGSSGKLRKGYGIMPPGDIINNIAALIPDDQTEMAALLLYRFPGENKSNKAIDEQKLGNLIMLAEIQRTGDFYKAIDVTKRLFNVTAELLPATDQRVRLSAITKDGRRVHGETTLDLATYSEPHGIHKVYLTPKHPKVNPKVAESLLKADIIISGPGDLYTNQLPVLIVPEIQQALKETRARKVFIINVANKPFETKGFTVKDYISAMTLHLGVFPFDDVIVNTNFETPIPPHYKYEYIAVDDDVLTEQHTFNVVTGDLINTSFPLYHDPQKLASIVAKLYNVN